MSSKYDCLKLENQLCFPLYACAKEVVRCYKPLLDELDLTYTQYIAMMVLWERRELSVKELGEKLYLDSGTLTPLLKKLESKGYITRCLVCGQTNSARHLLRHCHSTLAQPFALGCKRNQQRALI